MEIEDDCGLFLGPRVDSMFISGRTRAWVRRIELRSERDGRLKSFPSVIFESISKSSRFLADGSSQLTLLNAILLSTTIVLLSSNALNALIVVVLGGVALLGLLAFCEKKFWSAHFLWTCWEISPCVVVVAV